MLKVAEKPTKENEELRTTLEELRTTLNELLQRGALEAEG
jgi:hypothetical protein